MFCEISFLFTQCYRCTEDGSDHYMERGCGFVGSSIDGVRGTVVITWRGDTDWLTVLSME